LRRITKTAKKKGKKKKGQFHDIRLLARRGGRYDLDTRTARGRPDWCLTIMFGKKA